MRRRQVKSGELVLHVVEDGDRNRPGILFLHGFPDDHRVWMHQFRALSKDFHVIAFDLRGCGRSAVPKGRRAYRIGRVLPDILAVIDATRGPAGQVHLVAHDWGSVLGFSFVADPALATRVASFTGMSGPHVGLMWQWLRRKLQSGRREDLRAAVDQVIHSWYIFAMHVPFLAPAAFRFAGAEIRHWMLSRNGVPEGDAYLDAGQDDVLRNSLHAMGLYRQNAFLPPAAPAPGSIRLPVQLLLPLQDRFIRPQLFEFLDEVCTDLTRVPLEAPHWAQRSEPEEVTALIRGFITRLSRSPASKRRRKV